MSCIEAKVFKTLITVKRSIQLFVEKEGKTPYILIYSVFSHYYSNFT